MKFDINGARKAGYSDDEIAGFLAEQNRFDLGGALSSGYSSSEVIDFLLKQPAAPAPAPVAAPVIDYSDAATAMMGTPTATQSRGLIQSIGDALRPTPKPSVLEGYVQPMQDRQAEIDKRLSYGAGPISQETARQADVVRSTRGTRDAVAPANRQVQKVVQAMDERGEQSFGDLMAIANRDKDLKRIEAELEAEGRQRFGKENPILGSIAAGSAGLISGAINFPSVAADAFNQTVVNPVLRALGMDDLPRAPTAFGTEYLTKAASDYMPKIGKQEMSVAIARDEFAPWLMSKLAANSPQIAQSLVAAFVPPLRSVLLPGMGATAAGQSFVEGDDSRVALAKGAIEVGTEMLPLGVFDKIGDVLKGMSPVKANTVLAVAGQRALRAGGAITANTLTNVIEETAAQLGGNVLDKYFQGKDIELTKGLAEAAVVGAAAGGVMGTPQAAAAATGYYEPERMVAREIDAAGRAFDRVGDVGSQAVAIDVLRTEPGSSNLISPAATVTNFTPPQAPTKQAGLVDIVVPVPGGPDVSTAGVPGGLAAGGGGLGGDLALGGLGSAGRGVPGTAGGEAGAGTGVRADDASALAAGGPAGQPLASLNRPLQRATDADLLARTEAAVSRYNNANTQPAEIWTGRRGDGYATQGDAEQAMPGRQRKYPDLTWSIEQMPSGKFRLAGYSQETTLGTQADQAQQGQPQAPQAGQVLGAQAAAGQPAAAAQVELSDTERAGLKLALPAPAPTFQQVQTQLQQKRNVTVDAVPVAELTDSQRVASTVARMLGNTLTVVKATAGDTAAMPNGFINRLGGKHLFIDANADDAPVSLVLHEGLHSLPAERRKALNTALLETFNQDQKGEFLREFGYTADKFDEEAPAMMAQAISKRADFWEQLRDKMGNREFGEVAKVILTKLNQVITGTREQYGDAFVKKYISDVVKARDLLTTAYAETMQAQGLKPDAALVGEVQMSNRAEQKNVAASRITDVSADRFKRTPALQVALQDLQEGRITREEYSKVVDETRPVYPYKELPEITPEQTARFALANGRGQSVEKAAKYGLPSKELTQGEMVQLRLDIPSYQEHDAWVVTVHRPKTTNRNVQAAYDAGPTVGYESVASISNATFGMRQSSALKIAQGTSKGTIATVLGEWKPITPAEAKVKAQAAMKSPQWTQVGMDPFRHSYFYDRDSMRPVVAADEVIQVGPLVLAKNAKYDDELDVTGAPLMFSEKVKPAEPKTAGDYTYTADEKGRITVSGDVDRIRFLTRGVAKGTPAGDAIVFKAADAAEVVKALKGAPSVNPEIATAIRKQLGLSAAELASTSLEYQTGLPKDRAFVAPLKGGIPEVVQFLEDRRRQSGLRLLDISNPEDQDTLAKLMAAETLAAIRSSGNALEWYDETIARTLAMAAVKYPELGSDRNAQMAFRVAMAITSQGLNVENNLKFTMRQYDAFRNSSTDPASRRFPEVGEGDSSQAMVSNFKLVNEMLAEMGPDMLRRFLVTEFTIGELNQAGFEPGGELVDEKVLGSSVLGPKIGFGFYSNLNGNFEPVTMDMWFMRTIGRLSGNLRAFDAEKFAGQLQRFRDSFDERGTDGIFGDQFDQDLIERARTSQEAAIELARQVKKAHEKDYKTNRADFDAKTRKKSDLVLAADTMIQSVDKPKDVPASGSERRNLRAVVRKAVAEVEKSYGQRIPPAAMQALIWYPEQELYKAMGVKLSVTSQDYAGATEKVLTEEGYDAKRLRAAAKSGAARVRQANASDVGSAAQGDGQRAGRAGPLEGAERAGFIRARYERTQLERERLEPKRKGVIFEVAPDPNNEALTNAWRALSQEQRLAISERVARSVVSSVLQQFNTDGIIAAQVGSYLDDTNPSFTLLLNKGDTVEIARTLGFALAQDSMMVVSPKEFKGGDKVGAIALEVGNKSAAEIDAIYQTLREIRVGDEQPIGGQSYANGVMTILNYSNVPTGQLAVLVDQKLNKAYTILTRDVFAAFPGKQEYDYASAANDGRGSRADLRQRARALRAEATAALERELEAEGIEFANRAGTQEATQAERVTDLEPEDVLQAETIAAAEAAIKKYKQPDKPDPLTKEQRLKGELMLKPMFEAAAKNKPEFDDNLRRIADEVGGFAKTPGIKKPMRAVTKLVTEMNGNASKMKDLLRGTIVVGSEAAAQDAINKIGEVYTFDRIKNRMGADIVSPDGSVVLPETMPTGYQDILTNVVLADGTVAEIQLTTPEMAAAKHLGHEVYAFEREMPEGAVKDEMVALQKQIYAEGRASFDARQASQSANRSANTSLETSPAFSRTSEGLRGEGSGVQAVAEDMSAGQVMGTSSQSKNRVSVGSLEKSNAIDTSNASITKPMEEGEIMESRRLPKVSPQSVLTTDIRAGANAMENAIARVRDGRPVPNKLVIGRLPHVLNMLGARTQDFDIARSIVEKVFDGKHRDEFPDIRPEDLVRAMYRPAMIFKSKDGVAREFELVLPITNENGAMLLPVKVSVDNTDPLGAVMSIYNKRVSTNLQAQGEKTIMRRINDGSLLYVDPLLAKQALTGRADDSGIKANENFVSWAGVWPKLQKLIADRKVKTDVDLMRWIGDNYNPRSSEQGWQDAPAFSNRSTPEMGINVASDTAAGRRYADLIVDGQKTYESRETDSLRPYVGKRVAIVRTGEGKAKAIGAVTIGEPITVDAARFRQLEKQHMVPKGSKFDIKPGASKLLYPLTDPERFDQEYDVGAGIVSRRVLQGGTDLEMSNKRQRLSTIGSRFTLPETGSFSAARIKLQDDALRMKRVIDAVREQGGTVGEAQNFYDANTLMPGRIQAEIDDFKNKIVKPMLDKAVQYDIDLDELSLYAYAKHAEERNRAIARINPRMPDGGSGMKTADANTILQQVQGGPKFQQFEELHKDLMAIASTTRQIMLTEGIITQDEFDALDGSYANYIPLRGLENVDDEGRVRPGVGRGVNIRGAETIRALGRRSRASDLIENVIRDYERVISRIEKNDVGKVLLDFVLSNPDPDLWGVDVDRSKPAFNKAAGLVQYTKRVEKGEDTIGVKVGGQQVYIKFADPLLARALRQAWKDDVSGLERAIVVTTGWWNNWLRGVLTKYNPAFAAINIPRDALWSGTTAALAELGPKGLARYLAAYGKAMAASTRSEAGVSGTTNVVFGNPQVDRMFQEFRAAGGITGGFYMRSLEDITQDLRNEMLQAGAKGNNPWEQIKSLPPYKLAKLTLRGLEFLGASSENATRFALYMAAKESGRTPAQAALLAKNGTTNFNRKGEYGGALNNLYLFFNAGVQGTAQLAKVLRSPAVAASMAGVAGVGMMLALYGASGGGEDDDGEKYWDKIPSYVKERNLVIMLSPGEPLADGIQRVGKRGRYITIPVQYGFNIFPNMGYMMADVMRNAEDPKRGVTPAKAAVHMASVVFGSINPFGGSVDVTDGVQVLMAAAPTIVDLPLQIVNERTGFGRPSAPDKTPWDKRPDSERMFVSQQGTVPAKIAKTLNELGGGNEGKAGSIMGAETSITPGTIETLIRGTTGGLGSFVEQVGSSVLAMSGDRDLKANKVPFLNRFYGEVDEDANIRMAGDRMREVKRLVSEVQAQQKIGLDPELSKDEGRLYALASMQENYQAAQTLMRKEEIDLIKDKKKTDAEKRLERQKIQVKRDELATEVNKKYLKAMSEQKPEPTP